MAALVMSGPATYSAVELLRHGQQVEIRALRPDDRASLLAAVSRTSSHSLYRRFFAMKRGFTEQEIAFFSNVDFVSHVALVAVLEEGGQPLIVGGRYIVVQPGQAEVAFVVVDPYQGQGISAKLLHHLAVIARAAGLKELVAEVLPDNTSMLKVFERSGLHLGTRREPPERPHHTSSVALAPAALVSAVASQSEQQFRYFASLPATVQRHF
jgi:RimJ/RimL family protein N-acetyltransferase